MLIHHLAIASAVHQRLDVGGMRLALRAVASMLCWEVRVVALLIGHLDMLIGELVGRTVDQWRHHSVAAAVRATKALLG